MKNDIRLSACLAFFLLIVGCNNTDEDIPFRYYCAPMQYVPCYYEGMSTKYMDEPEFTSYTHYLLVHDYDPKCFNRYNFIELAYKYLDTATLNLPISTIDFCTTDEPLKHSDKNWGDIRRSIIIQINFNEVSIKKKKPIVSEISMWIDGTMKSIDFDEMIKRYIYPRDSPVTSATSSNETLTGKIGN